MLKIKELHFKNKEVALWRTVNTPMTLTLFKSVLNDGAFPECLSPFKTHRTQTSMRPDSPAGNPFFFFFFKWRKEKLLDLETIKRTKISSLKIENSAMFKTAKQNILVLSLGSGIL